VASSIPGKYVSAVIDPMYMLVRPGSAALSRIRVSASPNGTELRSKLNPASVAS
jgi:hypothetical protein